MALLRARQRAEAVAARKAEIRRRRENAARLVEVGLGSQLRFAGAVDALGLEGDEEEEEEEDFDEAAGDDLPPPLTIGFVGYPNVGERRAVLDSRLSREVVAQAESLTAPATQESRARSTRFLGPLRPITLRSVLLSDRHRARRSTSKRCRFRTNLRSAIALDSSSLRLSPQQRSWW